MKTTQFRLLLLGAIFVALTANSASSQTHVAEPAVNLGDTSFLDGIAGPGGVIEEIADGAHDGAIVDGNGSRVANSGSVNSVSGLTHVAWLSQKKVWGAWYGAELVGVAAYVDAGTQGRIGGFGDLTFSPLILQWPTLRLWGMPVDQRFVADLDFPIGRYTRTSRVNLGSNAYAVDPYYSITAHPAKRVETSWRIHYLWNSVNDSPPESTGYRSTQAGPAIHFNATAAYNVRGGLWVGSNAYLLSQIGDGRINGSDVHTSPERVIALGPGLVWAQQRWLFFANQYDEFGARNRATGQKLVLRVERIF